MVRSQTPAVCVAPLLHGDQRRLLVGQVVQNDIEQLLAESHVFNVKTLLVREVGAKAMRERCQQERVMSPALRFNMTRKMRSFLAPMAVMKFG